MTKISMDMDEYLEASEKARLEMIQQDRDVDAWRAQVEALLSEAGEAGDLEMVNICERALAGYHDAIVECDRVMADGDAQKEVD